MLYNNLGWIPARTLRCPTEDEDKAALALRLDLVVRENASAGWKGDETREEQVLKALYPELE